MIIVVISSAVAPGKAQEFEDFNKRVVAFNKKKMLNCIAMKSVSGQTNIWRLANFLESYAAWETFQKENKTDPESQALLKEWREKQYIVPGSFTRSIYEVIE